MNLDNSIHKIEELTTEERVRLLVYRAFSSNIFLGIAIVYSISFLISFISLFIPQFFIENIFGLIIPILLLLGIWKTYLSARDAKHIDTMGLRIVRGVYTFYFVLFAILTAFLVLGTLLLGPILIVVTFSIGLITYAFYSFRMTLANMISSFEHGFSNTNYYGSTIVFLIITIAIQTISTLIMQFVDLNDLIVYFDLEELIPYIADLLPEITPFIRFLNVLSVVVSLVFAILIVVFVRKLKVNLEAVHDFNYYEDIYE